MRRKTNRMWVACIVSAALTLTLGISCISMNNQDKTAELGLQASGSVWPIGIGSPFVFTSKQLSNDADPAVAQSSFETQVSEASTEVLASQTSNEIELVAELGLFQTAATVPLKEEIPKNPDKEVHIAASASPANPIYEVTAYYLNVRTNGYSKSKIKSVVPKGTRLEIVSVTEDGWLRIKGGGYVHGDYAKPMNGEEMAIGKPETRMEADLLSDAQELESGEKTIDLTSPVQPTSRVESESGLTEEDIALIFKGTDLAGHGLEEAILEVEETYGINALFTIAVMKLESGNGSSRLARNKNNLFGLNATGPDPHRKAYSFETKGESVKKFGQLLSDKYVDKGFTTIEKIATKYCPANSKWPSLVKNIMKKDYKKLNVI